MNSPDEHHGEGPVEVARAGDLFHAQVLASYLEGAGIPAYVPDEATMGMLDGAAVIWSKGVKVQVAAEHAKEAKRLLAEREERRTDAPDADARDEEPTE